MARTDLHQSPIVFWLLAAITFASLIFAIWSHLDGERSLGIGYILFSKEIACYDDEFSDVLYSAQVKPNECVSRYDLVIWNYGDVGITAADIPRDLVVSIPGGAVIGSIKENFRGEVSSRTVGSDVVIRPFDFGAGYGFVIPFVATSGAKATVSGAVLAPSGIELDVVDLSDRFYYDDEEPSLYDIFVSLLMIPVMIALLVTVWTARETDDKPVMKEPRNASESWRSGLKVRVSDSLFRLAILVPTVAIFMFFGSRGFLLIYTYNFGDVELPQFVAYLGETR